MTATRRKKNKHKQKDAKVKSAFDNALELWKSDKHDAALELFLKCEKTTKDEEDLAEVYLYKGWVLEEKELYDEAIQSFETASSMSTDSFVVPYSLHGQGSCHLNKGNFDKAADLFNRACQLYEPLTLRWGKEYQDHLYSCNSLLVHSLRLCGRLDEALKVKQKFDQRRNNPSWFTAGIAKEIGHYFYEKAAYADSIPYYEEALKAAQEDSLRSDILFYLGSALWHCGEREKGRLLVEESLAHLSDPQMKEGAKEFLRLADQN